MGKPAVLAITITGDSADASKSIAAMDDDLAGLGKAADRASGHLDDVGKASGKMGDSFDSTATKSATVGGAVGDLGGALSQVGGPIGALGSSMELLGPSIMGISGAADLAAVATETLHLNTLKTTASTIASKVANLAAAAAAKVMAAAQWLVNAAMEANPIGLIVLALVALGAAFVLAYKHSQTFRAIVAAVFGAIKTVVKSVGDFIVRKIPAAFGAALAFVRRWGPLIVAAVLPFIGIPLLIWQHWSQVKGFLSRALAGVASVITGPFSAAWQWIQAHVTRPVRSMFDGLAGAISRAMSGVYNAIIGPFSAAWDWIDQHVLGPIKTAWNAVAGAINAIHFSFKIPSFVPGVGGKGWSFDPPDVPTLARGGIVDRATLAVVGEGQGREIVTPETLLRKIVAEGSGQTIVINVSGALDPDAVARQIDGILTRRSRRVAGVQRHGARAAR